MMKFARIARALLKVFTLAFLLLSFVATPWVLADETATVNDSGTALSAVLSFSDRSPENRSRDRYRHPFETLEFFGLRSDMTVVELWPGSGWYTEILAPFLAQKGKLFVTSFDPQKNNIAKAFQAKLAANPTIFAKVKVAQIAPPSELTLAPDNSADMVLTFRNIHNWISAGFADRVYAAAYKALKPGGILGVVEHRAKPGISLQQSILTGYMSQEGVIAAIEKAGFKFAGESEVNANPQDTKDYPGGVWSLPPTLSLGANDTRYLAIGESDRMTLKFVKPQK